MHKFKYLQMAENRSDALKRDFPGTNESQRLSDIVDQMLGYLSDEEVLEYQSSKIVVETTEQIRARNIAELKAMEENREKPSH